ncbi:unnamed protein product [Auanema sp. JU1783]|nr:unnamed protein product [Auanema sp. JU1783]
MALDSKLKINEDFTNNLTDIDIYFARGEHGDVEALDGPGGIVAHSGLPPRGYLHLDADEQWSFDGINGIDLRYVILHETGHLLGLRHTRVSSAIMNPYYRDLKNGLILSPHDVHSIQKLYSDVYLTSEQKLLKL